MLKDGLYEQVINNKLDTELAECADKLSTTASIDKAEASKVLSKYLTEVVETHDIVKTVNGAESNGKEIDVESLVSMNMWGLEPEIFENLEKDFVKFLGNMQNPLKDEFFIPFVVDNKIKTEGAKVRVLETDEKWYGITYKEDLPLIQDAIKRLTEAGLYR